MSDKSKTIFDPEFTFSNFIISEHSNVAAYNAAIGFTEGKYKGLFIGGMVGFGKTHLCHAIAQRAIELNSTANIIYKIADEFVNDFIEALLLKKTQEEFREKYIRADIFLIEAVQFFKNKEASKNEFFYILQYLLENNRQIVMTSYHISLKEIFGEISFLAEKVYEVQLEEPKMGLKMEVLRRKAEIEQIYLSENVNQYISQISSNIREIEMILDRIIKYSKLKKKDLTLPLAQQLVKSIYSGLDAGTLLLF